MPRLEECDFINRPTSAPSPDLFSQMAALTKPVIEDHTTELLRASIAHERMRHALIGLVSSMKAIQRHHPDVVLTRDFERMQFAEQTLKQV